VQIGAGTINRHSSVTWASCLANYSELETAQSFLCEAVLVTADMDTNSIESPGSLEDTDTDIPTTIDVKPDQNLDGGSRAMKATNGRL
jgi:hypothetical protein